MTIRKTTITEMNRLTVEEFHKAEKMPLVVVLDDVRSLYNVGSVFRTADAFRVKAIYLCGITATPEQIMGDDGVTVVRDCTLKAAQEIHKTALGAEESVEWRYFKTAEEAVKSLKNDGFRVFAVEQAHGSVMLGDFKPQWHNNANSRQYAVVLGNEVKGVHQEVIDLCHGCLEIPQYGTKHSLNVSVTGGIIIWHFASAYTAK